MQIASWNVNSVRARLPRLLAWLEERRPDVVCLQETKVEDESFPHAELREAGYECHVHGQKTYNGVAILSRVPVADVVRGLPGDGEDAERRFIAATAAGIRVVDVYCPNGGDVGLPRYDAKLEWYGRLRDHLHRAFDPGADVLLCGDFNVAPTDRDVWDPELWRGKILVSDPERAALRAVIDWGFEDALRLHHPEDGVYTFWDYRAGAFHRGWGLRIDHMLTSRSLTARCTSVEVDREARKGPKPSDHAPVVATFA